VQACRLVETHKSYCENTYACCVAQAACCVGRDRGLAPGRQIGRFIYIYIYIYIYIIYNMLSYIYIYTRTNMQCWWDQTWQVARTSLPAVLVESSSSSFCWLFILALYIGRGVIVMNRHPPVFDVECGSLFVCVCGLYKIQIKI
jgi:hypothetical protein